LEKRKPKYVLGNAVKAAANLFAKKEECRKDAVEWRK
jgi:hypothetical protein